LLFNVDAGILNLLESTSSEEKPRGRRAASRASSFVKMVSSISRISSSPGAPRGYRSS
jgi:hypothetical protein